MLHIDIRYYKTKSSQDNLFYKSSSTQIPSKIDWRDQGYVTSVKDQGKICNSSWAFSSVATLEGQHFKATGRLVSLSEQNLIDCVKNNGGCKGGLGMNEGELIKNKID
jgi:cathepsin L